MSYAELPELRSILPGIASRADQYDQTGEWPAEDLNELAKIGAMRWAVPLSKGGEELSPLELHFRYEAIASASLATALILTQRDSAIGIIAAANESTRCENLLGKLANNELFATVGIAQLTTSRQRGAPALRAEPSKNGYEISGEIPWATGAGHAQIIVTGAAIESADGQQILFCLSTSSPGVRVAPPLPLASLQHSHTASVICENVRIENANILIGPMRNVLGVRRSSLPIGQSFLAMGLSAAAIDLIGSIDSASAEATKQKLAAQLQKLRDEILNYCNPAKSQDADRGALLRGRSIDLAIRSTHAAISLHKGSALLAGHPAQRLAREAMFLLVWSCPSPVAECTIALLTQAQE